MWCAAGHHSYREFSEMISRWAFGLLVASVAVSSVVGTAHAQTALLDEVHTISGGAEPVEKTLDITQSGAYQLTLTDLQLPAALTAVKLAVTRGTTVIGTAGTAAPNLSTVLSFDATPGTYVVRVVGAPAASAGSGTVGVKVTRASDASTLQDFVAAIAAPPAAVPENRAILDTTFTPTAAGKYEVVLSDLGLPQALPNLILSVTQVGGALLTTLPGAGTTSFAGQAGVAYKIVALAESAPDVNAGLFGVRVRDSASGNVVLSRAVPVGRVRQLGAVVLTAGAHVLSLTDFQFPAALSQVGAALSLDGQLAALTLAPGAAPFVATAGEHLVYSVAAAASSGTGSFGLEVRPASGAALFSSVQTTGGAAGATPAYSFVTDIATAGAYRARLADFAFPARFTSVQLAVAQSGSLLGTLSAPGSLDITAAAGRLFLVVLAQPSTSSGGVLGVDVSPAAGGSAVIEATQGVGNLFQARKITASGNAGYRVTLTDVGFPHTFKELGAVVTRGATPVGTVLGSTHFDFDATAGNYIVNFIATPDETENAGTYGILVADKPPSPTVTLTADPAEVTVGGTVALTWASTNASACVASNGWTGSRATSGTERSGTINSTITFKLDCSGDGGTTSQSLTVNALAQDSSGGGGAMDWLLGAGLALYLAGRIRRRAAAR